MKQVNSSKNIITRIPTHRKEKGAEDQMGYRSQGKTPRILYQKKRNTKQKKIRLQVCKLHIVSLVIPISSVNASKLEIKQIIISQTRCFTHFFFFCKRQDRVIKRNYSQANVKSEKKVTNFALPWQPWSTEQKYGMIANDNSNKIFIKYTRKYIMCYENKKID